MLEFNIYSSATGDGGLLWGVPDLGGWVWETPGAPEGHCEEETRREPEDGMAPQPRSSEAPVAPGSHEALQEAARAAEGRHCPRAEASGKHTVSLFSLRSLNSQRRLCLQLCFCLVGHSRSNDGKKKRVNITTLTVILSCHIVKHIFSFIKKSFDFWSRKKKIWMWSDLIFCSWFSRL